MKQVSHIKTNLDVFDFSFADEEMEELRGLDTGKPSNNSDAEGLEEMLLNAFIIED